MPNWCNNYVELQHEDPAMITRAAAALERGEFLQEFIPVPTDLQITAGNVGEKGSDEQVSHEAQIESNMAKHGYADWFSFCTNEWGTKWDVGGDGFGSTIDETGTKLGASFDSAWSPPIVAYEKLEELGFTVKAYYYEPGMCFTGKYEDGSDDYYEYSNMSSEEVEGSIPEELNEFFNISADMAEWEEENEEDEGEA